MKIILVKCISIRELENLIHSLLNLTTLSFYTKYNKRKKEIILGNVKFRFVLLNQNIAGIRYDEIINAYEFYKECKLKEKIYCEKI